MGEKSLNNKLNQDNKKSFLDLKVSTKNEFNQLGFPTKDNENWLYWTPDNLHSTLLTPCEEPHEVMDMSADICIVNGVVVKQSENLSNITISNILKEELIDTLKLNSSTSTISMLNTIQCKSIICIKVKGINDDLIRISNTSTCEKGNKTSVSKILIIGDTNSEANFVIDHNSELDESSATNSSFHVICKESSNLSMTHIFTGLVSTCFFHSMIYLYENSKCSHLTFVTNSTLVRHDTEAHFYEEGADLKCSGVGILKNNEQFYNHLKINHYSKDCTASQFFKNILDDKSIAEFSGLVFVQEGAHGVDSTQSNKTLLLSDNARVLSRPQLKIDADDVQCAHGSTIGQLNPEEIFYITSRGLTTNQAKALLVYGFAEEIIINIKDKKLKSKLEAYIKSSLAEINIK